MFKQLTALLALVIAVPAAIAEVPPTSKTAKTYTLSDVQLVVSNSSKCDDFYKNLQALATKPISLEFSRDAADTSKYSAKEPSGRISNHAHSTVKQSLEGGVARRVGVGNFEMSKDQVDYVIEIVSDTKNDNHQHLYPIILSGDKGRCYCTALVKPSSETAATFKKHIQSGNFAKGADLE